MRALLLLFLFLFFYLHVSAQHKEYELRLLLGNAIAEGQDVALDSQGNVYVADAYSIVSFYPDGRFRKEYTVGPEDYLWNVCNSVVLDREDNLYVLSSYSGKITKISNDGKVLHQFGGTGTAPGLFTYPSGIAVDLDGFIYIADTGNNRIQKFDNKGAFTLQYGQEGTGIGSFRVPAQITTDAVGNVYVADKENSRIQKFDNAGTPLMQYTIPDQPKAFKPFDVAVDAEGYLYTTDAANFRIAKFDEEGKLSESINFYYDPINNVSATNAKLAIDADRNIYIAEQVTRYYAGSTGHIGRLQKLRPDGTLQYALGRLGKGPYALDVSASRVAIDAVGNFYVANGDYNIEMFDKHGRRILTFGGYGTENGKFQHYITDLHLDAQGNLYVLSYSPEGYIHKFDAQGNFLTRFAKPEPGVIYFPRKIALDPAGNLYLSDEKLIHKFDKAGNRVRSFTLKDPGTGKDIPYYHTIAFDRKSNLYILHDYSIKKYDPDLKFLQQIGSYGKENDKFQQLSALVLDAQGNMYVSDYNTIKKLDATGTFVGYVRQVSRRISYSVENIAVTPDGTRLIACNNSYSVLGVMMYVSPELNEATTNLITGTVYADQDADCLKGKSEQGISNIVVEASPGPYFGVTDERGNYAIEVGKGSYTLRQLLPHDTGRTITETCAPLSTSTPLQFTGYNAVSAAQNFSNRVTLSPHLSVSVSSTRRRRCFESTTTVRYVNSGFATAPDTKVYLQLPTEVELLSADQTYTRLSDGSYEFRVGNLAAGQSGTITIEDIVTCGDESVRGLTVCTRAWITPSNNKQAEPTPTVSITGRCHPATGMVRFVLRNTGAADMADPQLFRKYADGLLASREQFRLAAGDSLVLWVPAMGYTWRLEADQPQGNGDNTSASVTVEPCSGAAADTTITSGFVNLLPADDEEAEKSAECMPITDSYDPNDKLVTPVGRTEEHYTPTGVALTYKISFQNTGTDVAYRIVVVDTLSEHLDLSTLQVGATSHPGRVAVSGKGRPVLTWTFDNIMLPDSTADEPGSHGYILFSIKPKADLAEKTLVENFADIFFDFNSPIRTNVTQNRVYDMPPVINETVRVNLADVLATPGIAGFAPAAGRIGSEVTITGKRFAAVPADNRVYLNGEAATVVSATATELRVRVPQGATTGTLRVITPDGGATSSDQFQVYQPPVLASFSPAEGMVGQTVTLTGEQLQPELIEHIKLGEVNCEILGSDGSTVRVRVPAGASTGAFRVSTKGGDAVSGPTYTVWYAPVITALSQQSDIVGASVTITGEHFAIDKARNQVRFGQALAQVLEASPQHLKVRVPEGAETGFITVETPGGRAATFFEVIPCPKFTAMQPARGTVGTVVEINGEHFGIMGQLDIIDFNGQEALVLESEGNRYRVRVPRGASTGKVTITGYGGQALSSVDFVVEELAPAEAIAVYPNPNSGAFTVSLRHADFDVQQIEVYDALGKRLHRTRLTGPRPEAVEISLPAARAGLYFLQIQTEHGLVTKKLTVL
ncbi:DUF7619 domain-containing protein [Pontibacter virosus]|uniref:Putative repeat protein (TIGR01451 family)/predicted secreted protein (Por secretion system target) n=1 Tax=Pontibacter virosus TaxID=1765052 RepID=A0A2U1ATA1_9BACT|nr:IPT/TIG domain-containing protein [Pontibacter virosus]PVY39655.1 putative repeat protein (TIGR01451 family)/predicted secreted protein (Por secretion system target) [Pontibacter virosus]